MSETARTFQKFGGVCFAISGGLFLAKSVLELMLGAPPTDGTEILAWVNSHELLQQLTPEATFFAVGFLAPAVWALYGSLAEQHRSLAVTGCSLFAIAIAVMSVSLVVQGRLVFPVYVIKADSPEIGELLVALYYGGLHSAAELMAFGTLVLSLAMWRGAYHRGVASLGFITVAADMAGAYPDRIGPVLTFVFGVVLATWFVAVGWNLYRLASAEMPDTAAASAAAIAA